MLHPFGIELYGEFGIDTQLKVVWMSVVGQNFPSRLRITASRFPAKLEHNKAGILQSFDLFLFCRDRALTPMPTPLQFNVRNLYPDCLLLELTTREKPTNSQQIELLLTLQCDRHWHSLLAGKVQFGLRGSKLTLHFPDRHAQGAIAAAREPWQLTSNAKILPLTVVPQFSPTAPSWYFSTQPGREPLQGALHSLPLATLDFTEELQHLTATVTTQPADVVLADVEGLWRHDISPNQHAVLERAVVRMLVETCLTPYLSCAYRASQAEPPPSPSTQATAEAENALQSLIQQLSDAQTDNFLELAKIAQLKPTEDFAGGNLLGANLSDIDFSGADLSRANLRGSELNDADLSHANLQGANLRGADLSGAYLSNANLSAANLYRGSLALANLGGANLSGANLQETNLTKVNFSNAKVENTQFGRNSGVSEETKQSLLERGAVFAD